MTVFTRAEAFAPATMANFGVGFDILGCAVAGDGDTLVAERRSERGAVMGSIDGDNGSLPMAADRNVASIAANALLDALDADVGVTLHLTKGLPIGSGLGSSAASSVVAVMAVNALFDHPFTRKELLPFAMEGEAAVSGYHADNVAPCLLGGITLTNGVSIDRIRQLPVPDDLWLALVTPDVVVPTAEARAVLPANIPLEKLVHQTGAVAALMDAIYRGDVPAMAEAMVQDQVVEAARTHLMPHIQSVREAAQDAGALAVVISGAGPTLCAVTTDQATSDAVAEAMQLVYTEQDITCAMRSCQVELDGASVLMCE